MNKFKVFVFPTFLFLDEAGSEKARITGYLEEDVFLNRLKEIRKGVNTLDYYLEKNSIEGGGKYLLEILNVYSERKDAENLEIIAERIRKDAPELYNARKEYIVTALTEVQYANRMYESFIPEMETLISYRIERLLHNDYLKMATAYRRSGQYDKAGDIHLLLIKLIPGDITVYTDYLRFLVVNNVKADPSAGLEGMAPLGRTDSERAEYYYWLSRYYQSAEDYENSGHAMAEAARLAPGRYSGQENLKASAGNESFNVSPREIAFPDAKEGSFLTTEIEILNSTVENFGIDINSTCSCLTVSDEHLFLAAGENLTITVALDTTGESGQIERTLIFRRTDEGVSKQMVSFSVFVN